MQYTIQDIFELRKQGRAEEAYNAVLPIYRDHHGHYTTLAMFWTAIDMLYVFYDRGEYTKVGNTFMSLLNLYPTLADKDNKGKDALDSAAAYIGIPLDQDGYYDVDAYLDDQDNWHMTDGGWYDEEDGTWYQQDDYYLIVGRKPNGAHTEVYVQAEEMTHAQSIIQDHVADLTSSGYDVQVVFNGLPEDLDDYEDTDPVYLEEDRQTSLFAPEPGLMRRIRENDGQLLLFDDDQLRTF